MRDTVHHRASMCDIEDFPLRACDMRVLPHFRAHPDRAPCACDAAIFAERVATYGLSLSDITKCCVPQIDELIFHHMS